MEIELGDDLGKLSFAGRLLDSAGQPQDGMRLMLRPRFSWEYAGFFAHIDAYAEGRFHMRGLKPGDYDVEILDWSDRRVFPLTTLRIDEDIERDLEFSREGR